MEKIGKKKIILNYCWILIVSVFVITICSKSSPLYPLNDWDDPNCFFTVGKAMAGGKILYKDIFEQKGPLLYMLHELTYAISHTTFIGVYFAEIAACFAFLVNSYRIMKLFADSKAIYAVFPFAAFAYTSLSFCCGDSAEEFCLPLLGYTMYIAMNCVKNDKNVRAEKALLCGICAGIVLWVKFTMLGFFIGFAAAFVVLYIRQKKYRRIWMCAAAMFSGALISSIPVVWYFWRTNSFSYLFEVYFYDNMFLYSTGTALPPVLKQIVNLLYGLVSFAGNNTFGLLCLVLGMIFVVRKEKTETKLVYIIIALSAFLFSFIGGRAYAYYSFSMTVFAPVGLAYFTKIVAEKTAKMKNRKKRRAVPLAVIAVSMAVTVFMCRNMYLMFIPKDNMPQFRFNKEISKTENATLLNYGFLDGGFYTVSGIVPDCRFFCELNVELPEMYDTQKEYAEKGMTDYIVTKDEMPEFEKYECIDECTFIYWSAKSRYYLYRLK